MKRYTRFLSLVLTLIMLTSSLSVSSFVSHAETEGACGDNLTWRFSPVSGVLTILGEGEMYDLRNKAPWKDYCSEIKTVILGTGVTSIGGFAFAHCSALENISIPLTVTRIGLCAFGECTSLKSITIPDTVTDIGSQAFIYCTSLEKVILGNGLTEVKYGTFDSCSALKDVTFGKGLTFIDSCAFYNCKSYENIVLPEQYIELDIESFAGTGFWANEENWDNGGLYLNNYLLAGKSTTNGTFVIKPGTKYVARYALYDLSPGTVYYPRSLEIINEPIVYVYRVGGTHEPYDSPYAIGFTDSLVSGGTRRLCPPEGKTGDIYYKFDESGTVLIFYGNGAIGNYEYYFDRIHLKFSAPWQYIMKYIDEVVIEEGITSIGEYAFPYVKKATLADSITHIDSYAIRGSFTSLKLPKNLEYICPTNFDDTDNLEELTISEDNPNFATKDGVLYSKDMKTLIKYPCNKKDECFEISSTVSTIDPNAFNDLRNLKTLYIPETVTELDNISTDSGVTIRCKQNSAAHIYAMNNDIPFEIVCDHSFTNYSYVPATCTENGYNRAVCDLGCGSVDKIIISDSALGHKYTDYIFNNDATCTDNGTSIAVCENGCGTTDTRVEENSALGHSFTDYGIILTADCTHDEIQEAFCDRGCGTKDVITIEDSALGHSFTNYEVISELSCTENGVKEAFCDNGCGEKDIITEEAQGHTVGEWIVIEEPTYDFEGYKIQNCTVCSEVVNTETIPVLIYEGFPDVKEGAWYYEGVEYCFKQGYIMGTDKGTFEPKATLTREQFVTILARIAGAKLSEYTESSFTDVKADSWYGPSVIWANAEGIVNGIGNGSFGVGQPLSREQLATMLYRFAQKQGLDASGEAELSRCDDADTISTWAREACAWSIKAGLLGSTSEASNLLSPKMTVTRAQAAKIFMSFDIYSSK